jgi:hypothetical protein
VGTRLTVGGLVLLDIPAPIRPGMSASAKVILVPLASSATGTFRSVGASCFGRRAASSSSSLDRMTSAMTSGKAPWVHQMER